MTEQVQTLSHTIDHLTIKGIRALALWPDPCDVCPMCCAIDRVIENFFLQQCLFFLDSSKEIYSYSLGPFKCSFPKICLTPKNILLYYLYNFICMS